MSERVGRAILEMTTEAQQLLAGVDAIETRMKGAATMISNVGKMIAGAFSVAAIGAAINRYADFTGQLTDMSAKTGIGVEALQRLKFAAEQNGGTIDQVTKAVTKLGANLAGGNKSALGALDALGLSFDKVRNMEPDKAFTTIADAIAKVPDPMAQSKLAMDLFGKAGIEVLPMMKGNLSETAAEAQRLGIVMSAEAVAAGDEFGDTMDKLTLVGQSLIAQVLEPMIPAMTAVAAWLGDFIPAAIKATRDGFDWVIKKGLEFELFLRELALGMTELGNKVPWLGEKLGASDTNVKALRDSVQQAKDTLAIYTKQTEQSTRATNTSTQSISRLNLNYAENETRAKKAAKSVDEAAKAHERFAKSVKRLDTTEFYVPLARGIEMVASDVGRLIPLETRLLQETAALGDEAMRWAQVNGATLAPSIKALSTAIETEAPKWTERIGATFKDLPNVILAAIQGGGSVLGAVGAHIGTTMMTSFANRFGPAISAALPFGIGQAVTALLPMLGSLFGPVLSKIGGFFRNLFGGPDAEELAGRKVVAAFERTVQSMLSETQKIETGNESWKRTVVVVRDAYLAMGRTEAEALAAVDALWKSSKGGADAVTAAIRPIQEALDYVKQKGTAVGDTLETEIQKDGVASTDALTEAVGESQSALGFLGEEVLNVAQIIREQFTDLSFSIPIGFDVAFPDFGGFELPIQPMAEGGFGRVTRPTLFLAGESGPEDFAFSGVGKRFGGGGSDMSGVESRLDRLERTLMTVLPSMVESAARHGAQTAGRRR